MSLTAKSERRARRYAALMEPGRYYSSRQLYELACSNLSANYQPKHTNAVSGVLGWAYRNGHMVRQGSPGRYRYALPTEVTA